MGLHEVRQCAELTLGVRRDLVVASARGWPDDFEVDHLVVEGIGRRTAVVDEERDSDLAGVSRDRLPVWSIDHVITQESRRGPSALSPCERSPVGNEKGPFGPLLSTLIVPYKRSPTPVLKGLFGSERGLKHP